MASSKQRFHVQPTDLILHQFIVWRGGISTGRIQHLGQDMNVPNSIQKQSWLSKDPMLREPSLLELARANMPKLSVDDIDVLVVDEIGKEISGTGMDTNVIGRLRINGEGEPSSPRIKRIVVRDVRGDSAYGIGLADVTTRRLVKSANWKITQTNVETSGFVERGKLPMVMETDAQAVEWALPAGVRVIRIANTLHLEWMLVSELVRQEIAGRNAIEVLRPARDFFEAWPT